jgi:hypothetical protein
MRGLYALFTLGPSVFLYDTTRVPRQIATLTHLLVRALATLPQTTTTTTSESASASLSISSSTSPSSPAPTTTTTGVTKVTRPSFFNFYPTLATSATTTVKTAVNDDDNGVEDDAVDDAAFAFLPPLAAAVEPLLDAYASESLGAPPFVDALLLLLSMSLPTRHRVLFWGGRCLPLLPSITMSPSLYCLMASPSLASSSSLQASSLTSSLASSSLEGDQLMVPPPATSQLATFFWPLETDAGVINAYVRALTTTPLARCRDAPPCEALLYHVALHHTHHFIFAHDKELDGLADQYVTTRARLLRSLRSHSEGASGAGAFVYDDVVNWAGFVKLDASAAGRVVLAYARENGN